MCEDDLVKAESRIDFDVLQFPIYLRNEKASEWYRFDSATKLVSVRKNEVVAIGIAPKVSKNVFIEQFVFKAKWCSQEEFEEEMKSAITAIGI